MASINMSSTYTHVFILQGIPGFESSYVLISIPLFVMYILSLWGNLLMLLLITMESRLHSPMYYFLYSLFLTDIILSHTILLKMFFIFWLNDNEITFISCFTQMFFIHCFASIESGILLAMAFDRYIAICNPLHYVSTLTNTLLVKIVLALVVRGTIIVIPCSWMASRLPYCRSHQIPHSFCEHMVVVKLACGDTTINSAYGLTVVLMIIIFDISCIAVSYALILRAVLRLSTRSAKNKAFGTCSSHISIIVMLYTLALFSIATYRIGHIAPYIHVILSNFFFLIPSTLNPIIYGMKAQEIRTAAFHLFTHVTS